MMASVVALIPARSGSQRVPGKNTRMLAGHPLLAYTIAAARESGLFDAIIVSTDSEQTAAIARQYGAEAPFLRPPEYAMDLSPDIEWVDYTLRRLQMKGREWDAFSILRPTSPFRQAETIRRAWRAFTTPDYPFQDAALPEIPHSLRAMERVRQHPAKMWLVNGAVATPFLNLIPVGPAVGGAPPHSSPGQALPPVWVQNASLEIAWSRTLWETHSISGWNVMAFLTEGHEGFDINTEDDWLLAEALIAAERVTLPPVRIGAV